MAYSTNFSDAAHRHNHAAECLYDCEPARRRRDVAGYLYGLAAECALKEILRRSHSRILAENPDTLRAHFPHIKTGIRDTAFGRHASRLQKFCGTGFMQEWDIAMRYAHRREVPDARVTQWRADAKAALETMEELG